MGWILIIGLVIALIIITFMLVIFMPRPKIFFHTSDLDEAFLNFEHEKLFNIVEKELFNGVNPTFEYKNGIFDIYQQTTRRIAADRSITDRPTVDQPTTDRSTANQPTTNQHASKSSGLIHIDPTKYPYLYSALLSLPDVRAVFMLKIGPKTITPLNKGRPDYANSTVRCAMPIRIPGAKKSGIWNDGETKLFRDREWVIYDDSRENAMFNKHRSTDLHLLIIDTARPKNLPSGVPARPPA